MLDVAEVPAGLQALDALVKEAEVTIAGAGTVQDGRYFLLFGGEVEPVQRAYDKACVAAGPCVRDAMLLPWAEERILPAVRDDVVRWPAPGDTLGVLQNATPPTLLRAVDAALKGALVQLVSLRVGDGLGGKAIAMLWGQTHDVEAALELAVRASRDGRPERWSTAVIRNADPAVAGALSPDSRFYKEWRG